MCRPVWLVAAVTARDAQSQIQRTLHVLTETSLLQACRLEVATAEGTYMRYASSGAVTVTIPVPCRP